MASENETVADIVREMRTKDVERNYDAIMRLYARRIESAYKRDVEELRECLKDAIHTECKLWDQSKVDCEKCLLANDCQARTCRKVLEGAKDGNSESAWGGR